MRITQAEIREKLVTAASKIVSAEEAEYFADEVIETHIRKCNVSNPLKAAVGDLEASLKNTDKDIQYTIDLPAYLAIDFQSHGPLPYIKRIHDELEKRAGQCGLTMAAFTNSQSMHTLHNWVQGLAKRGLVSIAVCNGGPEAVIPYNGTRGVFGTNPLAFGLPGENGEIHCIDMATSEIAFFEIMNSHRDGKALRDRSAVDSDGNLTTDAAKALDLSTSENDPVANLTPMGASYKGYYLVYLMEVLTSGLIGSSSSPEMSSDFIPEEHGSILMVFDPKVMGTQNQLLNSIKAIHEVLKEQKPKAGTTIQIPGGGNNKRYAEAKNQDIELPEAMWERLVKL